MLQKGIGRFLAVAFLSGILKRREEGILPPPPPFPKFELEGTEEKEEFVPKRFIGQKSQREPEKEKKLSQKREKEELIKQKKIAEKEMLMELKIRQKEGKKRKEREKAEKLKEKKELIRQKAEEERERKIVEKEIKETKVRAGQKPQILKKPLFEDSRFDRELRELEEGLDVPKAMPIDRKIEENIVKPHEVIKAEEEIERAIQGIKNYKEKKSIFGGLFGKRPKAAEELPVEFMPKTFEKIDKVEDIMNKVHAARSALMDFNLDRAKSIYIGIMGIYNSLSVQEKKKVYQEIKDLYDERKNAESLAIR